MEHYLINYANEVQAKYPSSVRTPLDVLCHLFFTNGNGYKVREGDLGQIHNMRFVALKHFYADSNVTKEHYMEYEDEYGADKDVSEERQFLTDVYNHQVKIGKISKDAPIPDFHQEAVDKFYKRYDDVVWLSDKSFESLKSEQYWFHMLELGNLREIYISSGYFLLDKFNENTDLETLKIGLALCKAYSKYYEFLFKGIIQVDWNRLGRDKDKTKERWRDTVVLLDHKVLDLEAYIGGR